VGKARPAEALRTPTAVEPATWTFGYRSLMWRPDFRYAERRVARVLPGDGGSRAAALTYVALEDDPNFLGPAPLDRLARQVLRSRGPSGPSVQYVLELARALRELAADDPHPFELGRRLAGVR
jgi:cation transport regulator ChaC